MLSSVYIFDTSFAIEDKHARIRASNARRRRLLGTRAPRAAFRLVFRYRSILLDYRSHYQVPKTKKKKMKRHSEILWTERRWTKGNFYWNNGRGMKSFLRRVYCTVNEFFIFMQTTRCFVHFWCRYLCDKRRCRFYFLDSSCNSTGCTTRRSRTHIYTHTQTNKKIEKKKTLTRPCIIALY